MTDIICPHCGFPIPVTGKGSTTVVKRITKPPETPDQILGDLKDPFWALVNLYGKSKALRIREAATLYVQLVQEHGLSIIEIHRRAESYKHQQSDPVYMMQLVKWLQDQLDMPTEETQNAPTRISSARRAE